MAEFSASGIVSSGTLSTGSGAGADDWELTGSNLRWFNSPAVLHRSNIIFYTHPRWYQKLLGSGDLHFYPLDNKLHWHLQHPAYWMCTSRGVSGIYWTTRTLLVPAIASSAKLGAGGAAVLPFQWGRQLPLLKSDASSDDDTGSSSSDSSRLIASGVWKSFWFFASSELGIGGSLLKTSTFCCRNQQNQVRI